MLAVGLGSDPVAGPQVVAFSVVFGVLGAIEAVLLRLALLDPASRLEHAPRSSWWPA